MDPVLAGALGGRQPSAATEPRELARQITAGERAVRDPASPPELVSAGGRTAQIAYRVLVDRPDWDAAVLAEVPAPLRATVVHSVAAGRELQALTGTLPTTLPAWRIVEPLPAPQLRVIYAEAQRRFRVPWTVLAAVHLVETGNGRIVGLSAAGAQGPMQFMPGTWARYGMGGGVWDTRDAILGAANYLAANGAADGSAKRIDAALFRYNNDSRYVRGVQHYAAVMQSDERAFLGLHAWRVYYRTQFGDVLLPTGYLATRPLAVQDWLARGPR